MTAPWHIFKAQPSILSKRTVGADSKSSPKIHRKFRDAAVVPAPRKVVGKTTVPQ